MVGLLYGLCLYVVTPNKDRLEMRHFDMKKINPDLAYIGVLHRIRQSIAFILRRPFKMRWFTTNLSDHILLGLTYFFYAVTSVMRAVSNAEQ